MSVSCGESMTVINNNGIAVTITPIGINDQSIGRRGHIGARGNGDIQSRVKFIAACKASPSKLVGHISINGQTFWSGAHQHTLVIQVEINGSQLDFQMFGILFNYVKSVRRATATDVGIDICSVLKTAGLG